MTFQRTVARTRWLFSIVAASAWMTCGAFGCATTSVPVASHADLACNELPDAAVSPLSPHTGDVTITAVTLEDLPGVPDEWQPNRVAGVRASLPAPPGWSRAFLERKILCYRAVATAGEGADMLLVEGSRISVRERRGQFEISVTSEEAEVSQRIVDSASSFRSPPRVAAAR